jgi:urease accessory protein
MERDARKMRGEGPVVFTQAIHGLGVADVIGHVLSGWRAATGNAEAGARGGSFPT